MSRKNSKCIYIYIILSLVVTSLDLLPSLFVFQENLAPQQMTAEIEYVADLIKRVHINPFHARSESEFESLKKEIIESVNESMPVHDFYFILNRLPHFIKDAHTSLSPPNNCNYLPARFYWAVDGLVVICSEPECGLDFGDKILSFGGLDPSELLKKMEKIIGAENIYWIREISRHRLCNAAFLRNLNLVDEESVDFLKENMQGNLQRVKVQLSANPPPTDPILNRPLFDWYIDHKYSFGYFSIEKCYAIEAYRNALGEFFRKVKESGVRRIVVDIRRNPGGNSWVVNEFLSYLPVRSGGWFAYSDVSNVNGFLYDIRYSPEASQQRGYSRINGYERANLFLRELAGNKMIVPLQADYDIIFYGDIYILTAYRTSSSANWFTVIFRDNNLGTVLGEPTGGKPTHFGDVLYFTTPYSKLSLTISHKEFFRPDYTMDDELSAYPDIYIPTTAQDIRENRDIQLESLKKIFSNVKE